MEGQQLFCTPEVWKQLKEIPLKHWVAISLDGSKILASGESYREVSDKGSEACGGNNFVMSINPLVLAKPHCFMAQAVAC